MIDVVLEDARWAGLEALAIAATDATLTHLSLDPASYLVCVMGCDDARIAELNAEFREKPTATNVLSWPAQELSPPQAPTPDPFEDEQSWVISRWHMRRAIARQRKPSLPHRRILLI